MAVAALPGGQPRTAHPQQGVIRGWRGSTWDLSPAYTAAGRVIDVVVPEAEYGVLLGLQLVDTAGQRLAYSGRLTEDGIVLRAGEDDLEDLLGFIAAEANHEPKRTRQRALDEVFGVLDASIR